jgi:hypothetical protein
VYYHLVHHFAPRYFRDLENPAHRRTDAADPPHPTRTV